MPTSSWHSITPGVITSQESAPTHRNVHANICIVRMLKILSKIFYTILNFMLFTFEPKFSFFVLFRLHALGGSDKPYAGRLAGLRIGWNVKRSWTLLAGLECHAERCDRLQHKCDVLKRFLTFENFLEKLVLKMSAWQFSSGWFYFFIKSVVKHFVMFWKTLVG